MARLNVNPTRMELSKLKKKLVSARRGHKLLKDKRDELMRQFMNLIRENRQLRTEVEAAIKDANRYMAVAGSVMQREVLETALMLPKQEVELEVSEKNVMSVYIPEFKTKYRSGDSNDIYSYGMAFTSIDLDGAVSSLSAVFPKMIRLAEIEKSCQLMADEIEKTRRRVNALEHIMIPDYEETIKFITMKLSENERSTTTSLMKVKDMVLKQSHNYQQ
ncbi:V-type ATP synthase subunit D [uncultured Ruminococcus sp.]|uniref:V-type ATP synthase subunit D n=1 Tax=uncultured Ruminococcus sp. TaxID=165186 RepID=UPI0026002E12|nr:V-type ATP synthase subunit D [uncultured Ruminococcus sp.]